MDRTNRSFKTSFLEKDKIKEEMRGEEDDTRAQGITEESKVEADKNRLGG